MALSIGVVACGGAASNDRRPRLDLPPETPHEALGQPVPLGSTDTCPLRPLTLADTLAAVLEDVRGQPASSRPFLRYVSAAQFRSGSCTQADTLERATRAVSKLVNSMSREPRAVIPAAVGPDGILLRLDLRDYGWQQPVTIAGQSFPDAWQAIAENAAIALELEGGAASELERELGTRVPVLLSSAFVATAVKGELYYAVLQLPSALGELKRQLGITEEEDLEHGPWARAAFSNSGASKQDRGVARYRGQALGAGYFWQTLDYAPAARSDALYLQPLSTLADAHEVIFSLPNGLPAYFASDGDGARLSEARFVIDPAQNNGHVWVTSSCVSCHNAGIITLTDQARGFVEANPELFTDAELARIRESFLPESELQALMDGDSDLIQNAAERAGQPRGSPNPVSRVALDYELSLSFDALAAELFLDHASLIEQLPRLPEEIAAAATSGWLERSVFEARYLEAACALYATAESSPVGCP